jgi:hypothetical protein
MCPLCIVLAAFLPFAAAASYWDKLSALFVRKAAPRDEELEMDQPARYWGRRAIQKA